MKEIVQGFLSKKQVSLCNYSNPFIWRAHTGVN